LTPAALLWLFASYLLGAFPTSYLVSRTFAGIDLRQHGSGNLGATNLYRVLGWKYAVPVALVDIAKGAIPVLVFAPRVSASELFALACGVAAILGHVFSVFVRLKGGKGVATAAGVMLGLTPFALGIAAAVWAGVLFLTGYVSVASIAAALVLPFAVYLVERPATAELLYVDILIALGVIVLHRRNIQRLLNGTEGRFGRRAASAPPT
jgi:glycerol-3-phosphate acyltransferase PlsY